MQLRFSPQRVHSLAVDDRAGPRTVVISVPVLKRGRISELPLARRRFRVQALDDLLVPQSMREHEAFARNGRRRISRPFGELPHQRRRELSAQHRLRRHRIVRRPEQRRPIVSYGALRQRFRLPVHADLSRRGTRRQRPHSP